MNYPNTPDTLVTSTVTSTLLTDTPPLDSTAGRYARHLLHSLGAGIEADSAIAPGADAAIDWAASGAMTLTGADQQAPLLCPAPLASCARGVQQALQALTGKSLPFDNAAQLLGERAAIANLKRQGSISAGGSCRLLKTSDSILAVNLARDVDWQLLPAWLQQDDIGDWQALAKALAIRPAQALLHQARLLGLAVAPGEGFAANSPHWYQVTARGCPGSRPRNDAPLVVDLSSLWAGPLCGHLLQQLGARLIKVESELRPDGARRGPARFYDLLNANKASVSLPFNTPAGRDQLLALIQQADIVIEASRPRALRQLGIDAEALVAAQPGLTWLSISGYGRDENCEQWIAYGDDAGVAAGLSQTLWESSGHWAFCGDAIADPLTGLHAALAGWASWLSGGGRLLSLSLHGVSQHCLNSGSLAGLSHEVEHRDGHWRLLLEGGDYPILAPQARTPMGKAQALGADNNAVLAGLNATC